ncbi:MAG: helix-turn-helix transcriptional regulator [Acidimicrobiales bacterium]|nr:helix-turn-helix transcriptional regulator [Acidimicrobiales bacterium]RZV43343.1 MAG: transcriptional regulator [Acidimicrobiales bacterium]
MAKTIPLIQEICCAPLSEAQLAEDDAVDLARVLKALADPVRLRLVSIIADVGEGCACDFPAILGKSQPTISHHLSQLVEAGILEREQRGKWAWFHVNDDRLGDIRAALG